MDLNIANFLKELQAEKIIDITKIDAINKIYHFNYIDKHYSIAKVNNVWELMDWSDFDIKKIYKSNFDLIYNLYYDL